MNYPIDYEHYTTEEIIKIVEFLSLLEDYKENPKHVDVEMLKTKYVTYRKILNNQSEEKTIDQAFEKQTQISIYQTMKKL
ncbi:UPF0223 family protein [Liberiplasma polymorphum]|uniref:UPF0223 family protein n=1 Tax=Liberiplasma polymorphum TaxID=3374570 RepID=UPI00377686C1